LPADLKQRTKTFALSIITLYSELPLNKPVGQVLGNQLLRSGTSVGANYREASRSRSDAEFTAKCGDSLKELEETIYWLELLHESGVVSSDRISSVIKETRELTAIFTTIDKNVKSRIARTKGA
jgi:four helix bundle protein